MGSRVENIGRNIFLASGLGLTALSGGAAVVGAVKDVDLNMQINQAKPQEVVALRIQEEAYLNLTLLGISGALMFGVLTIVGDYGFRQIDYMNSLLSPQSPSQDKKQSPPAS